jgi:hypothetical protein
MADPGAFLLTWPTDPTAAGYAVAARQLGGFETVLRFVDRTQAGNAVLTGLDPEIIYAVSVAAVDNHGRMSFFSPETRTGVPPTQNQGDNLDASDPITGTEGN